MEKIAARRFLPLSAEDVVHEIVDQINNGTLPNQVTEEIRTKLLESLKSSVKRDAMIELIAEEIENEMSEANLESELYERINAHISKINHMISDLTELKRVLQRFSKRQNDFVI